MSQTKTFVRHDDEIIVKLTLNSYTFTSSSFYKRDIIIHRYPVDGNSVVLVVIEKGFSFPNFILLAKFSFPVLQMLINVLGPCFSIIFSRFLLEMGTSSTTVGLIFNSFQFLWNFSGPILGPLLEEFSWRKVALTCSLGVSASLLLSAFATSSGFLLFSYSIIGGQLCFGHPKDKGVWHLKYVLYIWLTEEE